MVTAEELVVAMRGEGIDETTDDIQGMEDQFEETADSVGESADEMDNFADKWKGAMGAVVAGLAVASAGLLAQVPVLGEVFGGLMSIIDALAFQMDQVLRPVLTPLTNLFYDISNAIFQLDGPLGDLVGLLATVASVGIPAVAVLSRLGIISVSASGALGTLVGYISTFVSATVLIPAIIGAIIGVFGVWVLKIAGVLDAIKGLGNWISNSFPDVVRDGILAVIAVFALLPAVLGGFIIGAIEGGFDEGVERAQEVLDELIRGLARFGMDIRNAFSAGLDIINDILASLEEIASNTWDTVVEIVMQFVDPVTGAPGGAESAVGDFFTGAADFANPTAAVGSGNTTSGFLNSDSSAWRNENPQFIIDGRRMNEDSGRYRYNETALRGRFG